jgi:hypothetical protein
LGCASRVNIGDTLVFSVYCHDADTGAVSAADAAPSYWVRDDDDTAVASGTMDSGARTGTYRKAVAITTAAGYVAGQVYTIYIAATVDADLGGVTFEFKVRVPGQ